MSEVFDYVRLEVCLQELDWTAIDCREKIAAVRHMMDISCDSRIITLAQWRSLLERVSLIQAKCVHTQPDSWRRSTAVPGNGNKP